MSFFRDRSPVTPKITRAQGSGIRGSLRSCAVRSGLPTGSSCQFSVSCRCLTPCSAGVPRLAGPGRSVPYKSGSVARAVRAVRRRVQRLGDAVDQLEPAGLELLDALVLEDLHDVVE